MRNLIRVFLQRNGTYVLKKPGIKILLISTSTLKYAAQFWRKLVPSYVRGQQRLQKYCMKIVTDDNHEILHIGP